MTCISSCNPDLLNSVRFVIAIPSYNEIIALPILIKKLSPHLNSNNAVLILDDSSTDINNKLQALAIENFGESKGVLLFLNSNKKLGRGSAVRRGMQACQKYLPSLEYFVECDADGSHQVLDVIKLRDYQSKIDLVIGSRYLPKSKIIGWSASRKIFSRLLNFIIPRILRIPVTDITNGLRRYSPEAIKYILEVKPLNSGFTYLSEQIVIVHAMGLSISELPIIFIDRVAGRSTVTYKEILNSIKGVLLILLHKKRLNA